MFGLISLLDLCCMFSAMLQLGGYLGYRFVGHIHMPLLAHLWLVNQMGRSNTSIVSCLEQIAYNVQKPFSFINTITIDSNFILMEFSWFEVSSFPI